MLRAILLAHLLIYIYSDLVEYAVSTTTGVLRDHLERFHALEYIDACEKNGWPVKIKALVDPQTVPFRDALRPAFMIARFKSALVNWIVADDQVGYISFGSFFPPLTSTSQYMLLSVPSFGICYFCLGNLLQRETSLIALPLGIL